MLCPSLYQLTSTLTETPWSRCFQELRDNKAKQEEDIKNHVQETENMISEIKRMVESTEFTDHRLQEMLHSQLDHLEQQRRVLVQRLWQLREKHRIVEDKNLQATSWNEQFAEQQ